MLEAVPADLVSPFCDFKGLPGRFCSNKLLVPQRLLVNCLSRLSGKQFRNLNGIRELTQGCVWPARVSLICFYVTARCRLGRDSLRCRPAGAEIFPPECRFIQASQSGHQLPRLSSAFSSQSFASHLRSSFSQWLRLLRTGGLMTPAIRLN
jgi:hypothetical protein